MGPTGYLSFPNGSAVLGGGEDLLELRFRACEERGILLYASSSDSSAYFALGLSSGQLLIEFRDDSGLKEVSFSLISTRNLQIIAVKNLFASSAGIDPRLSLCCIPVDDSVNHWSRCRVKRTDCCTRW